MIKQMKKFNKFKKLAIFGLGFSVVAGVTIPFATSCSAASTVPDFLGYTNFSLGPNNSFKLTQRGIQFSGDGIDASGTKYKTSPGYVAKPDSEDPDASKKNNATNQFSLVQTLSSWLVGFAFTSSDLLANCYGTGTGNDRLINKIGGTGNVLEVAKRLATYEGNGSDVERYRVQTLTFETDTSSVFASAKKYGDATGGAKPDDLALTYTTNIKLTFNYWHTDNGQNVIFKNVDPSTLLSLNLTGLTVKLVPATKTIKEAGADKEIFTGLYTIQEKDKVPQISIGSLDAAATNQMSNTFLNEAIKHTHGDYYDSNLTSYADSHLETFKNWIKLFN